MAQKRHCAAPIVSQLRRADVELGKGKKCSEVCKRIGIVEQTCYRGGGSLLGNWPLVTGLQPPPYSECIGIADPRHVCGQFCSSSFGYTSGPRTELSYFSPILSLYLVQTLREQKFRLVMYLFLITMVTIDTKIFSPRR